jgi:hypothetical protein
VPPIVLQAVPPTDLQAVPPTVLQAVPPTVLQAVPPTALQAVPPTVLQARPTFTSENDYEESKYDEEEDVLPTFTSENDEEESEYDRQCILTMIFATFAIMEKEIKFAVISAEMHVTKNAWDLP